MLPRDWVDRLFQKFATMYGRHWVDMWAGMPMDKVKDSWSADLSGVTAEQIVRALDYLKANNPYPPTLPEFLRACRQFRPPVSFAGQVSGPREPIPDNVRQLIGKLRRG